MAGPYTINPNDPSRPLNSDEVQYGAAELRALKGAVNGAWAVRTLASSSPLLSTDAFNSIAVTNPITVTIPTGLTAPFFIVIYGLVANVIITPNAGVTLIRPTGLTSQLYGAGSTVFLSCIATNSYIIAGDLWPIQA